MKSPVRCSIPPEGFMEPTLTKSPHANPLWVPPSFRGAPLRTDPLTVARPEQATHAVASVPRQKFPGTSVLSSCLFSLLCAYAISY